MVFSSTIFIFLFLPIVLCIYYNPIIKERKFKNYLLFLASLCFYAWGEPVFVIVMIGAIIVGWLIGLIIEKSNKKKLWLIVGETFFVALLFVFKYLSFIMQQLGLLFNRSDLDIYIALPIGISFFSFQMMSYLFDIYYGKAKAQRNVFYVGLYISLFPQLIAGPIVRYELIADEIINREENKANITEGMLQFIYGLGKKVLIANYVAQIADNIFLSVFNLSVATAWIGAIAYTLQIYFDFSGYSDMAIGMGRMFGFHFPENFNYPYIAKSITDFWRRWHISLSSWFRDYVYIPLGGNRVKRNRWILNMFVVWALTGIWHGANWTFLVWGLIYFFALIIEKLTGFTKKLKAFSHIYTMIIVIVAWVFFRADDVGTALRYVGYMFGINTYGFIDSTFLYYFESGKYILLIGIVLSTPVYRIIKEKIFKKNIVTECMEAILAMAIFILSLIVIINATYNPFIYFNF